MSYFNLPISTNVNRFIPKNAFDAFTNAKQKKKFTDVIDKITWLSKLSKETINVVGKEIIEIQIIEIRLKEQLDVKELLDIIDKVIPYQIIFLLVYKDLIKISTSIKHIHALNNDTAVIDWPFSTIWLKKNKSEYQCNLKISLDFIIEDLCFQIAAYDKKFANITALINFDKEVKCIKSLIVKLKNDVEAEKQFNKKVVITQIQGQFYTLHNFYPQFLIKSSFFLNTL